MHREILMGQHVARFVPSAPLKLREESSLPREDQLSYIRNYSQSVCAVVSTSAVRLGQEDRDDVYNAAGPSRMSRKVHVQPDGVKQRLCPLLI